MTSKLKQNLRYKKAHQRLCKTVLPPCPKLRRLLQLDEAIDGLSRYNNHLWQTAYDKGFRAGIDNDNPAFFEHFQALLDNQTKIEKARKAIDRLEKQGFSLDKALELKRHLNAGRLSQSY